MTPSIIQEILNQGFPQRRFMNPGFIPQGRPINPMPTSMPQQIQQQTALPQTPLMMQSAQNGFANPAAQQAVQQPQAQPQGLLGGLDDPRAQGLLSAAASLLQSSGWSPTPVTFGQALGGAAGTGLNAYNQSNQANLNKRYVEAQIGKLSQPELTELMKNAAAAGIQPGTPEFAKFFERYNQSGKSPYFQFLPTAQGYAVGDARTGQISGPSGIIPAQYDPRLQASLSGAKTGAQESSKDYNELIKSSSKVEEQLSMATDTLRQFQDYSQNKIGGTGPFATGFGLKQYTDADTQSLEAAFRTINLKNMAATFEGMSRAIDTQAERMAWEKTQPGIVLDDPTNYQILVGNISMATKAKAEAEARKRYIESNPDASLKGYVSPVFGKTKTLFDANGNASVVPNENVQSARQRGLMTADEFNAILSGKKRNLSPSSQSSQDNRRNITVDY